VKAATGEIITAEELGGADVHARKSGVSDYMAENEPHALALARRLVANIKNRVNMHAGYSAPRHGSPVAPPLYDVAELDGVVPQDAKQPLNMRAILARLLDGSRFDEFKALYGETIITGVSVSV
jgi:3-methylcrotonyl-CoA carboxylase beta subunit